MPKTIEWLNAWYFKYLDEAEGKFSIVQTLVLLQKMH